MRIRTIKPEFFTHEGLYDAEKESKLPLRIAFAGLWCAADRAGRFKWEPRRLGVAILPYDGCEFSRVLDALLTRGFIVKYRVEGVEYGAIPSFQIHQIINNREKESILPPPSAADDSDATTTRASRVPHASKEEGKGREGEGNTPIAPNGAAASPSLREKKDVLPTSPEAIAISNLFGRRLDTAWSPKEITKYRDLVRRKVATMESITIISEYYRREREKGTEGRHRRDLGTFLNNFDGELDRAQASNGTGDHVERVPAAFRVPMSAPPTRPT